MERENQSPVGLVLSRLEGVEKFDGFWKALCPAHDDHNPSLCIREGENGKVLLKCHSDSNCDYRDILKAIDLAPPDLFPKTTSSPWIFYSYLDEQENLLYQVARTPEKDFPIRRPDGKRDWIWNKEGLRLVLYRLPDLLKRSDRLVFVVEGEKDVDRLFDEGLLATTNPQGAGCWKEEYSKILEGRDVVILPDNDEAGRKHTREVAASLSGKARSVKLIELPGLHREKEDISDWLNMGHTVEELQELVEKAPEFVPSQMKSEADADGKSKKETLKDSDTKGKQIVDLVLDADVELFHDQRGEPFAAIEIKDRRRIHSLESQDFSNWLSLLVWRSREQVFSKDTIATARQLLSGMARFEGKQYRLNVRHARHDDAIWIDLDGSRAIKVLPGKWEVMNDPPILFRSFPHQESFPEPTRGGNPWHLLQFLNLKDEDAQTLLLCFLVTAMIPEIPIPALVLHGPQGSAKTTSLKFLKDLIDPSRIKVQGSMRDTAEMALAASQSRVLFFDNLGHLPAWLSDALCRIVSGEAWSTRRLYTNEEVTVFEYRGIIGLAGINLVARRPDLLDRCLIVELDPIAPEERREERRFRRVFEEARPGIFGGLLDTLAKTLEIAPSLSFQSLPRMADFAYWAAAAAEALGRTADSFLSAYSSNVVRQNAAAIEESTVAQTMLELMDEKREGFWEGTTAELLKDLEPIADRLRIERKSKKWPKSPSALSRRLREVEPNLLAMGVEVKRDRSGRSRSIKILRCDGICASGDGK